MQQIINKFQQILWNKFKMKIVVVAIIILITQV